MYDNEDEDISVASKSGGGLGRKLFNFFMVVVLLGLLGVVGYLLAERNARRYFLVPSGNALVVHRGKMFPTGSAPFRPADPAAARAYADVTLPAFASGLKTRGFDERNELDVALAGVMLSWSQRLVKGSGADIGRGVAYLDRVALLSGVTETQKQRRVQLEREVAFHQGRVALADAIDRLNEARAQFERAAEAGGDRAAHAQALLRGVNAQIAGLSALRASAAGAGKNAPVDKPAADPEAAAPESADRVDPADPAGHRTADPADPAETAKPTDWPASAPVAAPQKKAPAAYRPPARPRAVVTATTAR